MHLSVDPRPVSAHLIYQGANQVQDLHNEILSHLLFFFFFFFFLLIKVDLLCVDASAIGGFRPLSASCLNLVNADDSSCRAIHVKKSGNLIFNPNA